MTLHDIKSALLITTGFMLASFQSEAQTITTDSTLSLPDQLGYTKQIVQPVHAITPEHYISYTRNTERDSIGLTLQLHSDGDNVLTPGEVVGAIYRYANAEGECEVVRIYRDQAERLLFSRDAQTGQRRFDADKSRMFVEPYAICHMAEAIDKEFFGGRYVVPRP